MLADLECAALRWQAGHPRAHSARMAGPTGGTHHLTVSLFVRTQSSLPSRGVRRQNPATSQDSQGGTGMSPELRRLVETTLILTPELEDRSQVIFETVLNSSPYIDQPNFTALCDEDLSQLFAQYDQRFFGGACQRTLHAMGSPLDFRVSPRMTRAGGKTTRMVPRVARGLSPVPRFEIAVSSTLLFQTFADVDRPIKVTGLMCFNRLE